MTIKYNEKALKKLKGKIKLSKKSIIAGVLATNLLLTTGCNRSLFDTNYGLSKALITSETSSIILDIEKWKDYSGEQLQLITDNNFVLLTSAFDTDCFYGNSIKYSINEIAASSNESSEVYDFSSDNEVETFNKTLLDTTWTYNKSIIFNKKNALVLPIAKWRDYDGEQVQVITEDGMSLILSSYNSKLVYDGFSDLTAHDFAKAYVGTSGNVTDLSTNSQTNTSFNYDLIDFEFSYNKAIIVKENTITIVPIIEWCDYEGEQLQLKIKDGPTIVTATYDTILVDDTLSTRKAIDIAKSLCPNGNIIDYAENYNEVGSFNKTIIDLNYGYSNAIISDNNASTSLKINQWCDYEGEQLQITLPSGDIILTSSMLLDLINGGTSTINSSTLSKSYIDETGKIIDYSLNNTETISFNKQVIDLNQTFKYALKIQDDNVTIIPLKRWADFYNSDGNDDTPSSPNCEQIQLILPDDTALVTTSYNTVLVNNVSDIEDIAEFFRGSNGTITNLTEYVGAPSNNNWNITLIDTRYKFTHAILSNGNTSQILPITKWIDYRDGEQLQIKFDDNTGILTSYVNTTLVSPKTPGIEEIIANAFSGNLNQDKGLVRVYK